MAHQTIDYFLKHVSHDSIHNILRIQSELLFALHSFAYANKFTQLLPLLLSPITDPLNHSVYPADLTYKNRKLKLTASMIFHKQLSFVNANIKKLYIVSPNIRLELDEIKSSKHHMIEFSQFDVEIRDANRFEVMTLIEELLVHVFNHIETHCAEELHDMGSKLPRLKRPFKTIDSSEISSDDLDAEINALSYESDQPFFLLNLKREFYDAESSDTPGTYNNFDLIYPQGFGEALSGAEREYEYAQIIRRMDLQGVDKSHFENYLEIAKHGKLSKSAGFGIGLQRLLRFICAKDTIKEVCYFDRSVGSEFIF